MQPRTAELVDIASLSPSVKRFRFRCTDGQPLGHEAGQWVDLHLPGGGGTLKRAYSVSSAPGEPAPDQFETAVTRVQGGEGSGAMHSFEPGTRLQFDGPHGFFTREGADSRPALFVGAGTGICPLRAMLAAELPVEGPPLTLLFGCRDESHILFRDDLERWQREHPRFRLHVTLSRPGPGWPGRTGRVQAHVLDLVDIDARPHVYVCGLRRMVQDVRSVLKERLGYDRALIHSERYD